MDKQTRKVTESAVAFLVIFMLIHLWDDEFLNENWRLIKAFGVSRVLVIGLLMSV
jgi:hypothetical protein